MNILKNVSVSIFYSDKILNGKLSFNTNLNKGGFYKAGNWRMSPVPTPLTPAISDFLNNVVWATKSLKNLRKILLL